jgi:hypothetical protein
MRTRTPIATNIVEREQQPDSIGVMASTVNISAKR